MKKITTAQNDCTLADFNHFISQKKYDRALPALRFFLKTIEQGNSLVSTDNPTRPPSDIEITQWYTQLAEPIVTLFIDPDFILNENDFFSLIPFKRSLEVIFQLSQFATSDVILQKSHLIDFSTGKLSFNNKSEFYKLLFCLGLNSVINLDYRYLLSNGKMPVLASYFAQLSNIIFLNTLSNKKYIDLISQMDILDAIDYLETPQFIELISTIWMSCSYQNIPDKHLIKNKINSLIQRTCKKWNLGITHLPAPKSKSSSQKPTLLVIADVFKSTHAMYRTFSKIIIDLKEQYSITLLVEGNKIDKPAKQIFDSVIEIKENAYDFESIIQKIHRLNPPIIFYPSLGMSNMALWLANIRLAPIQIMSTGHPASSFTNTIDFMLMDESFYHPSVNMSEKIILAPAGSYGYKVHPERTVLPEKTSSPEKLINIAVPCNLHKITLEFLNLCKEITETASKQVRFHFFPNVMGTHWHLVKKQIQHILPSAIVHKRDSYSGYLALLAQCDFALSTFPFGGYNSTLETLELGLPIITLEGIEIHEKTDSYVLRYLAADPRLIASTKKSYLEMTLRLIEDETLLAQLSEQVKNLDFTRFMEEAKPTEEPVFSNIFKALQSKKDFLFSSEQKIWPYSSLILLNPEQIMHGD